MQQIQEATFHFFGPVTVAYLVACLLLLLITISNKKDLSVTQQTNQPNLDLALAFLASFGVLIIGNYFRLDKIFPIEGLMARRLWWVASNLVIYSPIFIVLIFRRQSLDTVYLSNHQVFYKILAGLLAGLFSSAIFFFLRDQLPDFLLILPLLFDSKSIFNFPAIFLEGVALAFLFERVRWKIGIRWSLLSIALLFALAHVPGSIAQGDSMASITAFFILNGALASLATYACYRAQDIIFLGMVHYVMDITIKAF